MKKMMFLSLVLSVMAIGSAMANDADMANDARPKNVYISITAPNAGGHGRNVTPCPPPPAHHKCHCKPSALHRHNHRCSPSPSHVGNHKKCDHKHGRPHGHHNFKPHGKPSGAHGGRPSGAHAGRPYPGGRPANSHR